METKSKTFVACDLCRKYKKKCSGGPPPCELCKLKKVKCIIPEERKKNKRLLDVSSKLEELELEYQKLPSHENLMKGISDGKTIIKDAPGSKPDVNQNFNSIVLKPLYFHLVDSYLNTFQKVYPFISENRIKEGLKHEPENSALLNGICCFAYRYSSSFHNLVQSQNNDSYKNVYYDRTLDILNKQLGKNDIELVQSYLLLSCYDFCFCFGEKPDNHLASAISIAKILGIHHHSWYFTDVSNYTEANFEGAATWTFCHQLDSINSIMLVKPYIMSYHSFDDENDRFYDEMAITKLRPELEGFRLCCLYYKPAKYLSRLMTIRQNYYQKLIDGRTYNQFAEKEKEKIKTLFPKHLTKHYFLTATVEQDPSIIIYRTLKLGLGIDIIMGFLVGLKQGRKFKEEEIKRTIEDIKEYVSLFDHQCKGYWIRYDLVGIKESLIAYHLLSVVKMYPQYFDDVDQVTTTLFSQVSMALKFYPIIHKFIDSIVDISIAHVKRNI